MPPVFRYTDVPLPTNGMAPDLTDDAVPNDRAEDLLNLLLDRPGRLVPRGPILQLAAPDYLTTDSVFGSKGWVLGDNALVGLHELTTNDNRNYREYWKAPYKKVNDDTALAGFTGAGAASTTSRYSNLQIDTNVAEQVVTAQGHTRIRVTTGPGFGWVTPGLRGVRVGDWVWGHAYTGGSTVLVDGGKHLVRRLLVWAGGDLTTSSYINTNVAPASGMDIAAHYERLFVLGGIDPADPNGPLELNTLFFTNPGPVGVPSTIGDWQTNSLTNKFIIGAKQGSNDFGVALAHVGSDLLILKRRSVWILRGSTSDTFTVRQLTSEFGCVDPRSVLAVDDVVYFMSQRGLIRYDGAQFKNATDGLNESLVIPAVLAAVGDSSTQDGGFCSVDPLPDGYALVSVGQRALQSAGARGVSSIALQLLYDTDRGTWVRFSTAAPDPAVNPWFVVRTPTRWLGLSGVYHDMQYVVHPERYRADTGGSALTDVHAARALFPVRWRSKRHRGAGPVLTSVLHQVLTEYVWPGADGHGWTVAPLDLARAALQSRRLPAQPDGVRHRDIWDDPVDVEDLQLQYDAPTDLDPAALDLGIPDIRTPRVAWLPSSQRR